MKQTILLNASIEEFEGIIRSVMIELLKKHFEKTSSDKPDEVLNREQVLEFLGCSSPTLINHQKNGLPFFRLGRSVYFKKTEILEFAKVKKKGDLR